MGLPSVLLALPGADGEAAIAPALKSAIYAANGTMIFFTGEFPAVCCCYVLEANNTSEIRFRALSLSIDEHRTAKKRDDGFPALKK